MTELTGCDNPKEIRQIRETLCSKPTQKAFVSVHAGSGSYQKFTETIPIDTQVKLGSIIVLDMTKPLSQHFVRVVAVEEREDCKWKGLGNEGAQSSAQKFGIYTATFLSIIAVPISAVGHYAYSRSNDGGCEGWSYKEAFKQINWHEILSAN